MPGGAPLQLAWGFSLPARWPFGTRRRSNEFSGTAASPDRRSGMTLPLGMKVARDMDGPQRGARRGHRRLRAWRQRPHSLERPHRGAPLDRQDRRLGTWRRRYGHLRDRQEEQLQRLGPCQGHSPLRQGGSSLRRAHRRRSHRKASSRHRDPQQHQHGRPCPLSPSPQLGRPSHRRASPQRREQAGRGRPLSS